MGIRIGSVLYVLFQLIALVLLIVGTPLEQFRTRHHNANGKRSCITLWGVKSSCGDSYTLTFHSDDVFAGCDKRNTHFKVAEAFTLITIILTAVSLVAIIAAVFCCRGLAGTLICVALSLITMVTGCVPWALMTNNYFYPRADVCDAMKHDYEFGNGFILIVTGWSLVVTNLAFLILPF